jgi:hypothetical protein
MLKNEIKKLEKQKNSTFQAYPSGLFRLIGQFSDKNGFF